MTSFRPAIFRVRGSSERPRCPARIALYLFLGLGIQCCFHYRSLHMEASVKNKIQIARRNALGPVAQNVSCDPQMNTHSTSLAATILQLMTKI